MKNNTEKPIRPLSISDDSTNHNEKSDELEQTFLLKNSSNNCNSIKLIENIINKIGYSNYHRILIFICGVLYFSEGAQLFSLNMLMPAMRKIFSSENVNDSWYEFVLTFMASAFFFGFMMGTFFVGYLTKKYGRRNSINVMLNLYFIFSILIFMIENIYWITFMRVFIGFCMGILSPQFITNLSEFLPTENKEMVILSMYIFYRMGIIYFLFNFKLIMPNYEIENWRYTFFICSLPILLILVLSHLYLKDSPKLLFLKKIILEPLTLF